MTQKEDREYRGFQQFMGLMIVLFLALGLLYKC